MDPETFEEGRLSRDGFAKQRRNLLLISVVLAGGLSVGISFEQMNAITVLGQKILFENPERLDHLAWGVWGYFLYRYIGFHLQFQKSEEKFLVLLHQFISPGYDEIMRRDLKKSGITRESHWINRVRVTMLGASFYVLTKPIAEDPAAPLPGRGLSDCR